MAEWVVRLVEDNVKGTFNTLSPIHRLEEVVESAALAATSAARITWIPTEWLAARDDPGNWGTVLFWELNEGYLTRISNDRAVTHGLTFREIGTTLADTLDWYKRQPRTAQATLNAGFQRDPASGDFVQMRMSWPEFLELERVALADWHAGF